MKDSGDMRERLTPKRQSASTEKPLEVLVRLSIPEDSRRFDGHFPGAPIYPAVAQLIDLILPEVRRAFGGAALLELKRVKWIKAIKPGDKLTLALSKKAIDSDWVRFELRLHGEKACSGMLILDR